MAISCETSRKSKVCACEHARCSRYGEGTHISDGEEVEQRVAGDFAEESVFLCELIGLVEGDEELAGVVAVATSIGHAHKTSTVELEPLVDLILPTQPPPTHTCLAICVPYFLTIHLSP